MLTSSLLLCCRRIEPKNRPAWSITEPTVAAIDGEAIKAEGPGCVTSAPRMMVFLMILRSCEFCAVVWLLPAAFKLAFIARFPLVPTEYHFLSAALALT